MLSVSYFSAREFMSCMYWDLNPHLRFNNRILSKFSLLLYMDGIQWKPAGVKSEPSNSPSHYTFSSRGVFKYVNIFSGTMDETLLGEVGGWILALAQVFNKAEGPVEGIGPVPRMSGALSAAAEGFCAAGACIWLGSRFRPDRSGYGCIIQASQRRLPRRAGSTPPWV